MTRSHGRERDWVEGVRDERQSFRAKQGSKSKSGKPPGSVRPGGQRPRGLRAKSVKSTPNPQERERERERKRVLCSEDLYSWWDRRKKVTY